MAATRKPRAPRDAGLVVQVDGAVSDGKGGYLPKGHRIEDVGKETRASLIAKKLAA